MGIQKLKKGKKPTQPEPKTRKDEKHTGKKLGGQK